jgi:hypothetical protein
LYLGRKVCGLKLRELAEELGVGDYSVVAMGVRRWEEPLIPTPASTSEPTSCEESTKKENASPTNNSTACPSAALKHSPIGTTPLLLYTAKLFFRKPLVDLDGRDCLLLVNGETIELEAAHF